MADIEKLKASIAKVKAITGKKIKTTVETTTVAPAEEYPLNHE
jgi:hypothetical protein